MASLIKPSGLDTYGNELTGSASLTIADNIVIDQPNVIQKRRGFAEVGQSLTGSSDRHNQVMVYKDRILRHFNNTLQFDSSGTFNFTNFAGSFTEAEQGVRIKSQEANGNLYFTTDTGIKKISAKVASDLTASADYITSAGGVQSLDLDGSILYASSGFFTPQSKIAYRLVWAIKDKNNNIIRGYPSSRLVVTNTSDSLAVPEVATVTVSGALTASQYFLIFSKETGYYVWFNTTGTDPAPITAETIGRIAIEVNTVGLTTNDQRASAIAAAIATISDFSVSVNANVVTVTIADESVGDVPNISNSSPAATNIATATIAQGSITDGQKANTTITSLIPDDVLNRANPTNFFYELYRTSITSNQAQLAISLDDLDPGDEMNKVYEANITSTDVSNGFITIADITPESFRETGPLLYTNPVTGEGILQANEKPPIAKDIELFKNFMFYANTKTIHKLTLTLLSTSSLTSNVSEIIIGNSVATRTYTFRGTPESYNIICDSRTNTATGGYVTLHSANNKVKYAVWFDKTGGDITPVVPDAQLVRVDISPLAGIADTANATATALGVALNSLIDFNISVLSSTVSVTNVNNGDSTNTTLTSLVNAWVINSIVNGTGEDTATAKALLSTLASASQAVEESAKSLIKCINSDTSGICYAYYISGQDDLPGQILLKSRTIDDNIFNVLTSDSNIQNSFNPSLAVNETVTDIKYSAGSNSPAKFNVPGHNLTSGTNLYIYNTATSPVIRGNFEITVLDVNNFTIPFNITGEDDPSSALFAVVGAAVSDNEKAINRLYYSKIGLPEAVPSLNYIDVGPKDNAIKRILALRDNLLVLKEDGVYIITGTSSPFASRLLDSSTEVFAGDTAVVLSNQVFCLSTQGVVTITETGVGIISRPIEDLILAVMNEDHPYRDLSFGVGYESDRAYILHLPTSETDTVATQAYRFNTVNRTWTRWTTSATCGLVNRKDDKLYLGSGSRSYLNQERKSRLRTDYSDRDFNLTVPADAIIDDNLELSSVADVSIGDVIQQDQYVSIAKFNMLLRKLDLDGGLDSDYESVIGEAINGDNLQTKMTILNAKLVIDDVSGIVTSHAPYSSDITTFKDQFNALITELNNANSDTNNKDYKIITDLISFEANVQAINKGDNIVTLNIEIPFIQGAIKCFKAIKSEVEFSYQTFGEPEIVKQVREATVLLDQDKFYDIYMSFKSDISQSFEEVRKFGSGIGAWGQSSFGETVYGGNGTDGGIRVLVPQNKQRCRYLIMKLEHRNAREEIKILGISAQPRSVSSRGYK